MFSDDKVAATKERANPFREIRRLRGMRASEVAEAMGVDLRSYQNLEVKLGPVSLAYVDRFARVTDSDAVALKLTIALELPWLAARCADNKLATWILTGLEDLERGLGDAVSKLESAVVISVIDEAVGKLIAHARRDAPTLPGGALEAREMFLTARQIECLEWVQAGKSSSVIGQILGLSKHTVDEHLAEACKRLGVRSRIQAVSIACELGLLPPSTP
ncbi:MAG: LuxR C-terminal-related transcriptional regulator [Pseudomonadota bacterium]